ncbi:hypothetical protein HOD83_00375 [Candidatus Woesearchaeota archaeon]|jgi:hypothetical protein|nr:hypothetical protein [Candidatus Woesearchaeota archaeon]MBT4248032.1 hypothetical protein [Candidatus Woesearchaeota archaeon]
MNDDTPTEAENPYANITQMLATANRQARDIRALSEINDTLAWLSKHLCRGQLDYRLPFFHQILRDDAQGEWNGFHEKSGGKEWSSDDDFRMMTRDHAQDPDPENWRNSWTCPHLQLIVSEHEDFLELQRRIAAIPGMEQVRSMADHPEMEYHYDRELGRKNEFNEVDRKFSVSIHEIY